MLSKESEEVDREELKALKQIHDKKDQGISPNLYGITNKKLQSSFKTARSSGLASQLKSNIGVFSAFKAHAQSKELARELVGNDGKLRTFGQFVKATKPITDSYNRNYLAAEFQMAQARGRTALQFEAIEKSGRNIEWLPSRSASPRPDHVEFYGIVKPASSSFWVENYPGNLYGCKCDIAATNSRASKDTPTGPKPVVGLDKNPYLSREVFTETHPYIKQTANKAVRDFVRSLKVEEPHEVTQFLYANRSNTKAGNTLKYVKSVRISNTLNENDYKGSIGIASKGFARLTGAINNIVAKKQPARTQTAELLGLWREAVAYNDATTYSKPLTASQKKYAGLYQDIIATHTFPDFIKEIGGKLDRPPAEANGYSNLLDIFEASKKAKSSDFQKALRKLDGSNVLEQKSIISELVKSVHDGGKLGELIGKKIFLPNKEFKKWIKSLNK